MREARPCDARKPRPTQQPLMLIRNKQFLLYKYRQLNPFQPKVFFHFQSLQVLRLALLVLYQAKLSLHQAYLSGLDYFPSTIS